MSRDPQSCPYWQTADETANRLTADPKLREQIVRAMCDAWETGVYQQFYEPTTIDDTGVGHDRT